MEENLDLEIRKNIYKFILSHPGINLSSIADHLRISVPLADYHLHYLEENNLITIIKESGYKRYYVKGKIGSEDKKTLSLLYQEFPLQIVYFLLHHPHSKPRDMRQNIEISPALLTYYLKKLVKYGIIAVKPFGEKKQFSINNQEQIVRLLIQYKPNLLLKRFRDTWALDFPLSEKIPKKKKEE